MAKRRRRRRKHKRRNGVGKTIFLSLLCVFLLGIAGALTYVAYLVSESGSIDPESIYSRIERTSFLYDADGGEIARVHFSEDREIVPLGEINDNTQKAFIAVEDKTFYKHHGFNIKRIIGAIWDSVTGGGSISGTSTITQQLARNVFLADTKSERTIQRKVTEMFYAWQIEQSLSKDEILEAYLNTIYLGYGCYGIENAANIYFGKHASELTLSESAALAALPQAPDSYALLSDEEGDSTTYLKKLDVYANDASKDRRDMVLDLMAEQGYISQSDADGAKVAITDILKPDFSSDDDSGEYTYFADYVISQVISDLMSEYNMTEEKATRLVHTGGLQIYSTVDPKIQKIVNEEFKDDYNFPYCASEEPQGAMVITSVSDGRILSMVGGRSAGKGKKLFNRAISPRQPGSSIKPLSVYSAALQKSYEYREKGQKFPFTDYGVDKQGASGWGDYITASSKVTDEKMVVSGNVWPKNFSRGYSGYRTFRTALQQSINTCAVKIQLQVGADYSIEMLKKYGISTVVDDTSLSVNDVNSAAMALGAMTYGVTPLDMALAYGAFPNGGIRNSGMAYTKVLDADGKELLTGKSEGTKVLDEGVAFIMTDVLKSVVSRGIAGNASIYGVQVGGKTGTTNDNYDYWFCGFTPKYSAALWIGTDKNHYMSGGSYNAASLWSSVMSRIPDVTEGEYKDQPSDVIQKYGEYYTEGTAPSTPPRSEASSKKKRSSHDSDDDDDDSSGGSSSGGSSHGASDEDVEKWYKEFLEED